VPRTSVWSLLPTLGLLIGVALLAPRRAAYANGRFPAAQHVVIGPGASSDVIALRVTFGLILSTDGGRTFRWMCEEGLYVPFVPRLEFDPPIELSARRAVVFGYEIGIRYLTDTCKAEDVREVRSRSFSDLTSDPTGRILYAVEDTEGMPGAVYRGDGDNDTPTFARQGSGVRGVRFDTIEVAPSNPMRLYLSARSIPDELPSLYRSDDGGVTLTPLPRMGELADSLWVSGVDPRDPDTLYVRAARGLDTELRRSRDGGRTFQRVLTLPEPMLGFALSDDGRTVWVGSASGGLLRSEDGGDTFRVVHRLPIMCLRQHAGALYACSEWTLQGFILGRSRDRGDTFEPVLQVTDEARFLGPGTCASPSEGAMICAERWPAFRRSLVDAEQFLNDDGGVAPSFRDAGRRDATVRDGASDATAGIDAGPPTAPADPCGCRVPGAGTQRAPAIWGAALLALFAARRRRR
jgi:MYXO-CTERM domain-containing protein